MIIYTLCSVCAVQVYVKWDTCIGVYYVIYMYNIIHVFNILHVWLFNYIFVLCSRPTAGGRVIRRRPLSLFIN